MVCDQTLLALLYFYVLSNFSLPTTPCINSNANDILRKLNQNFVTAQDTFEM